MNLTRLQERLGYQFADVALLQRALTHPAYANETNVQDNQSLEFLGEAVVDLIASTLLLRRFPQAKEGELSKRRAGMVNEAALAQIARRLALGTELLLNKADREHGAEYRPSILADALEAVVGAIFQDAGFERTLAVTEGWFEGFMDELYVHGDAKSRLQERTQKRNGSLPVYTIEAEEGPPHERVFTVRVEVEGRVAGRGVGRTKKEAEQTAAAEALKEAENA
jgi:ribonuclease III